MQQPSWRCFAPLVLALPSQQPDLLPYPVASGELSYTDVSGNRTVALLTTGIGIRRAGDRRVEAGFSASMRYGRSEGDRAAESYTTEVSARFPPRSRVSPFLHAKGERNLVKNLDLRLAVRPHPDPGLIVEIRQPGPGAQA